MNDVPVNDLVTMFKDSIILYKGRPHYVLEINANKDFRILDIEKQRQDVVKWDFKLFRNPTRRLGMVNLNEGVCYVSRIPHRKYSAGINRNNISVEGLDGDRNSHLVVLLQRMKELTAVGIADSLNNAYPSFEEAKNWVTKFHGTYAFDKQFAISTEGYVWYKTKHVGNWTGKTKEAKDIVWLPHCQYLQILVQPDLQIERTH